MRNPFRLRERRRGIALVGVLCAALGLVAAPATAAFPAAAPPVPTLAWQPCFTGFSCATAAVPLDYADPTGATINIAVIKHPATDPAHRIGSIFFNPGGPGGGGLEFLPQAYSHFSPAVRARFDVVSFDPRGTGQSTALQCFDTIGQEQRLLAALPVGSPTGAAEERLWENTFATIGKACAAHAGPLLAHVSTAEVARDMDLLRRAVGSPTLNYLGASYGTILGATYANLFPSKVGAFVLDGNADPEAWVTGTNGSADRLGTLMRLRSDEGSALTLNAFLDLCGRAATAACAFSAGSAAATHAKYTALLDRLASHPVTVAGKTITKAAAAFMTVGGLYSIRPFSNLFGGWSNLATLLQTLWTQANGGPAPASGVAVPGLGVPANTDAPYQGQESTLGVLCSDSPSPRNPARYPAIAAFATARSGAVGPYWAWLTEACAQWPVLAPDRYTGPWNHPTAPILVIGNTIDPATPYSGAVAMSHDLANARLLTVNGVGHSALLNHSSCVDSIEDAYFVSGALPRPGTVCQQDEAPFAG